MKSNKNWFTRQQQLAMSIAYVWWIGANQDGTKLTSNFEHQAILIHDILRKFTMYSIINSITPRVTTYSNDLIADLRCE